ncbi:MAG TPA: hypothetical protein VGN57_01685 [Pirellulaceae bacterium]|nr:hypothetical protein [Pirellulaceae bacterium]
MSGSAAFVRLASGTTRQTPRADTETPLSDRKGDCDLRAKTVEYHRQNVREKLSLRSGADVTRQ